MSLPSSNGEFITSAMLSTVEDTVADTEGCVVKDTDGETMEETDGDAVVDLVADVVGANEGGTVGDNENRFVVGAAVGMGADVGPNVDDADSTQTVVE